MTPMPKGRRDLCVSRIDVPRADHERSINLTASGTRSKELAHNGKIGTVGVAPDETVVIDRRQRERFFFRNWLWPRGTPLPSTDQRSCLSAACICSLWPVQASSGRLGRERMGPGCLWRSLPGRSIRTLQVPTSTASTTEPPARCDRRRSRNVRQTHHEYC